jgi:hypothetical protein
MHNFQETVNKYTMLHKSKEQTRIDFRISMITFT